ncbi:hypothetical protein H8N03_01765 [Ramlibacter sp. USB13]|uniref:Toxic anion resistance protein n=1 Tax=Ramlibacter cellulosilyticus TaxID=2764187 RepID=A0A923MN06_9BURK|nr:hypothetical protein [Ramlibacter cellulosilyticus]MBC5781651.1 hypothetical protein [Ramlibacter cellulosilyticus]
MTDFSPESAWIESPPSSGAEFWEPSGPGTLQEPAPALRPARRPAPALAADVNELLESMARKRVPRLDAVRQRLQAGRPGLPLDEVAQALQALQAATGAVDFLAGRSGGERSGEFLRQGEDLVAALRRLGPGLAEFLQREAVGAPVTRLVWMDLVVESGSLRKRVRQGARWLAEMEHDLLQRRKAANNAITQRAIDELARRATGMHERLQAVHRLCTHARSVHGLSERMAAERTGLWTMLQDRVLPACTRLDEAVQPLLHAAAYRVLVPTELIGAIEASHELQVDLAHASARIARLGDGQAELAAALAAMEDKARALNPQ